jgi:hypothetical protein
LNAENGSAINLEVKYKIPAKLGDSFIRLVAQMQAMVSRIPMGEKAVVWTLKQPTAAEMRRLEQVVGPEVFNQVEFIYGVENLYIWIQTYFGM